MHIDKDGKLIRPSNTTDEQWVAIKQHYDSCAANAINAINDVAMANKLIVKHASIINSHNEPIEGSGNNEVQWIANHYATLARSWISQLASVSLSRANALREYALTKGLQNYRI
jgi:hypothetical protein